MPYTAQRDLYASKTASDVTSEVFWVGDARELTLQILGSPSTTTVQGSNGDGRVAALSEDSWSDISAVIGANMVDVEPGFRWLRCLRSETTQVLLNGS